MTKIYKKSKRITNGLRRLAEMKPTSLSARDPVAFAAALMILG